MPLDTNAAQPRPVRLAWDFTTLADTYDFRPDYCASLIHDVLDAMRLRDGDRALDIGAGTGKLTARLCAHGLDVTALEPNERMRGIALAKEVAQAARWIAAYGEALPVADASVGLVTFGSSFNVVRTAVALDECARVLRPGGYWLAVYNHRDLDDPLQRSVEAIIHRHIPGFEYGRRRASPAADLSAHGAFGSFASNERRFVAQVPADDWMRAWHSQATLQRQAGDRLPGILAEIRRAVESEVMLSIPYTTRAWIARRAPA
jgi:ubiquinone/menaquinone biosynthesis C-methylase UbiE